MTRSPSASARTCPCWPRTPSASHSGVGEMYETLVLERPEDGIVIATLNRPQSMNALRFAAFAELRALAEEIGADESVRALVITGAGRGFCAGLDLDDATRLNSPFGIRLTKEILQTNVDAPSLEAAIALENRSQVLAVQTRDMSEALAAFREKRLPAYQNH